MKRSKAYVRKGTSMEQEKAAKTLAAIMNSEQGQIINESKICLRITYSEPSLKENQNQNRQREADF